MRGNMPFLVGLAVLAVLGAAFAGAFFGARVTDNDASPAPEQAVTTVEEHLLAVSKLFGVPWPHLDYPEEGYTDLYRTKENLLAEWVKEDYGVYPRVYYEGVDMARAKLEDWRDRCEAWLAEIEAWNEAVDAAGYDFESDYAIAMRYIHSRAVRILEHVDALLEQ